MEKFKTLLKLENHKKSAMVVQNGKNETKTINVKEYRWSHLVVTCHVSLLLVVVSQLVHSRPNHNHGHPPPDLA